MLGHEWHWGYTIDKSIFVRILLHRDTTMAMGFNPPVSGVIRGWMYPVYYFAKVCPVFQFWQRHNNAMKKRDIIRTAHFCRCSVDLSTCSSISVLGSTKSPVLNWKQRCIQIYFNPDWILDIKGLTLISLQFCKLAEWANIDFDSKTYPSSQSVPWWRPSPCSSPLHSWHRPCTSSTLPPNSSHHCCILSSFPGLTELQTRWCSRTFP